MAHFKINEKPMLFHLIGLTPDEFQEYKVFIEASGGKLTDDGDECLVKFSTRDRYQPDLCPLAAIYDIQFIRKCIHANRIVDPAKYRLGHHESRDTCAMAHFLYGCHNCMGQPSFTTQPQELAVKSNESIVDEVCPPSQQSTLTPEFVSAQNSDRADNIKIGDEDEFVVAENPVAISQPVDESQVVLSQKDMRKYAPLMACGDVIKNNNDQTNDINEKRPCSLEYQLEVRPKLEKLAEQERKVKLAEQQRRDLDEARIVRAAEREVVTRRQQRSPRTMTKRQRVMYKSPEMDYPVKKDTTKEDERTMGNMENTESANNAQNESNAHSPNSGVKPDSPCMSDNVIPNKKSRYLTVIPIARQRLDSPSYGIERRRNKQKWVASRNCRTKNGLPNDNESIDYTRIQELNRSPNSAVLNPLRKNLGKKSLSKPINADRETRRTDLLVNSIINEKRSNKNLSARISRYIPNVSEKSNWHRENSIRECHPVKNDERVQKKSKESNIGKGVEPTKVLQDKKLTKHNHEEDLLHGLESSDSDLCCEKSVRKEVARAGRISNTANDSSWNQPGTSGTANKKKKENENRSEKANLPIKPTKNGTKSEEASMWVSSSDSDDDSVETEPRRSESRKKNPLFNKSVKAPIRNTKRYQYRKPFTMSEKLKMIQYLIENDAIEMGKGIRIWTDMIENGHLTHRTSESLRNNMKRSILPVIEQFDLDHETLRKFLILREGYK